MSIPNDAVAFDDVKTELVAALKAVTDRLDEDATKWKQPEIDAAQNERDRLIQAMKEGEERRKDQKEPYLEAGRAIDREWNPLIQEGKELTTKLRRYLGTALEKQQDLLDAALEGTGVEKVAIAGTEGRKTSLRQVPVVKVENAIMLAFYYGKHPKVQEVVEKLALADVKAGKTVPHVKVTYRSEAT